jgi:hypothetical protein
MEFSCPKSKEAISKLLKHEPLAFENDEMEFEVEVVGVGNEVGKLEARKSLFHYRILKFEFSLKIRAG